MGIDEIKRDLMSGADPVLLAQSEGWDAVNDAIEALERRI